MIKVLQYSNVVVSLIYQKHKAMTTTAAQIRREVKKLYNKHFAVVKMKYTGLDTEWSVSNCYTDDFSSIAAVLRSLGFNVINNQEWNKNSFVVKAT